MSLLEVPYWWDHTKERFEFYAKRINDLVLQLQFMR